ncbi:MAG: serine/threonine-protein phosphatase [Clostridia bacterium]|nr:serine/threonine-protein phosphatase [Clostridia bacterium]
MKLISGYCSDKGNIREKNEDAILIRSMQHEDRTFLIAVVCDGIGGLDGGELASEFVIRKINAWFNAVADHIRQEPIDGEVLKPYLQNAVRKWNDQLVQYMLEENLQMGSTMSLIMIVNCKVYGINIGDSRVYCYNRSGIYQCTEDTSVSQYTEGRLKVLLESYMGKNGDLWIQNWERTLEPGDLFLLCTDGFYHFLTELDLMEMYKKIENNTDLTLCCHEAVKNAMNRGSRDNVTLGLVYVRNPKKKQLLGLFPGGKRDNL